MEEQTTILIKIDATDAVARGWSRCGTVRVAVDPSGWIADERSAVLLATSSTREGLAWRPVCGLPQTLDERGLLDAALAYAAETIAEDDRLAREYLDDPSRVELPYREAVAKRADVQAEHARRRKAAHEHAKATLLASDGVWERASRAVAGGYSASHDLHLDYTTARYLDATDPDVRARFERDRERTVERLARREREAVERAERERAERERTERARLDEARIVLGAEWTETDEARVSEGRLPALELRVRIAHRLLPDGDVYERLCAEDVQHDDACYADPDEAVEFSANDEGDTPYPLTAPQYEALAAIRATVAGVIDAWSDVLTLTSSVTLRLHTARCTSCGERATCYEVRERVTRYGVRVRVETPSGWSVSREYALR